MENEPTHELGGSENEISLKALSERLGFNENDELSALRQLAIEASAMKDTDRLRALLMEYQLYAEKQVNSLEGSEYMRGQVGLIVAKATLHRDTGNLEAFLEDINDAKEYAYQIFDDETVSELEIAPSQEIARILATLGGEYGFDEQTVAEIATEPYDRAFEVAYSYLMEAGLDANEVLSAFIESTED